MLQQSGRDEYFHLDALLVGSLHLLPVLESQPLRPVLLVQVQEHGLFKIRFSIGDGNRVVVTVQAVDQSLEEEAQHVSCCPDFWFVVRSKFHLYARLLQVSDIACALPRLDPHHDLLRADGPEGVDHDFALDGLYRVDDHRDRSRIELFEGLERGRGR